MRSLLVAVLLLLLSCSGDSIYKLKVRDLSGREVSLESYRGKPLIVYVWSGTCIGHTEDLKRLVKIYPKLGKDVSLISIAIMMDESDVKEVLRKNGIKPNFPVYADPRGEFSEKVTLIFLPATIKIDERGNVRGNYPKLPQDLISLIPSHQ